MGRFDNPELNHILPTLIHKHVINGQIWQDGDSGFYRRVSVPTLLVFGMKDKVRPNMHDKKLLRCENFLFHFCVFF